MKFITPLLHFFLTVVILIFFGCIDNTKTLSMQKSPNDLVEKLKISIDEGNPKNFSECFIGENKFIEIILKEYELIQSIISFKKSLKKEYGESSWVEYNELEVSPSISFPKRFPESSAWPSNPIFKKVNEKVYEWTPNDLAKMFIVLKDGYWFIDLNLTFGDGEFNCSEIISHIQKLVDTVSYGKSLIRQGIPMPLLKKKMGEYVWGNVMYK